MVVAQGLDLEHIKTDKARSEWEWHPMQCGILRMRNDIHSRYRNPTGMLITDIDEFCHTTKSQMFVCTTRS